MIPLTELLIGLLLGLLSAAAVPLTLLLVVATALRDNGVLDHPIPVWVTEERTIRINPSGWGFWRRGALLGSVVGLWAIYTWGLTNAASMPRTITRTGLGTAVILGGSFALFVLKVRHLVVYGIVEVGLGVVVAALTMYRLGDEIAPFEIASVVAAVYFVVRGLDNLRKGLEEKRPPPTA